jgi:threonine aldolase
VVDALAGTAHHLPAISALTIENTAMAASGRPWRPDELDAVLDAARDGGLMVHCDGARVWNAAVALDVEPAVLVGGVDTVMFCLSKGLGAPVGSLLCGARDRIDRARVDRSRLGGRMRQAGIIAAAGIVALETMVDRLADDHARARALAEHLADVFPGSVDPTTVDTNIVCARLAALPPTLLDDLAERGVLAGTIDPHTARFVLHKDVEDAQLRHACDALDEIGRTAA